MTNDKPVARSTAGDIDRQARTTAGDKAVEPGCPDGRSDESVVVGPVGFGHRSG
ncbi:hypothetical protein ACWDT6_04815 [Nocardia grenadensis]|uniref:hypothetical protein n=1 Tax=Nocardia grenadensis TaxID=931537 RepID=UPI003D74B2FC